MADPSAILSSWAKQGAVTTAKKTADSVRAALKAWQFPSGVAYDVYLQGSYRNDTNIRGDSDVDVVAELHSTFHHNVAELPVDQQRAFHAAFLNAAYSGSDFRRDVTAALAAYYGASGVDASGNKSITIKARDGYLPADLVPCTTYRHYSRFLEADQSSFVERIRLCTLDGTTVVNFPKRHYDNGCSKSDATGGEYKPTVRVFKNARTWMVENGGLQDGVAPSYFVECLLYNAPSALYVSDYTKSFPAITRSLQHASLDDMLCQNGVTKLFGSGNTQWSVTKAQTLLSSLESLWKAMTANA